MEQTLELAVLPIEVQELANKVTLEKREEVSNVLNQIFAGTTEWKAQVDAIEVKGIDDVMSIKLADTARLNAKNARLDAEKVFDAKRDEVQQQMSSYQLEDKLWLKAKQTMQLLFKDIEDSAKYKAEYAKRYEAEQKELKTLHRANRVQLLNPNLRRSEFENMSDDTFEMFVKGIENEINERIEAEKKAEAARLEAIRIENERIEAQRIENEKLKKENEAKELELQKEREAAKAKQAELEKKAKAEKEKQDAILAEQKRLADIEAKKQADIIAKQQAELKAKQDAETKAQKEREAVELKAKQKADELANAPIKNQLLEWVNSFKIDTPPSHAQADIIQQKFESFKKWALNEIVNLK